MSVLVNFMDIYNRNFCKICEGYSLDSHSIGLHACLSWNYPGLVLIWPLVSAKSINLIIIIIIILFESKISP